MTTLEVQADELGAIAVGIKLYDLEDEIRQLFGGLNFLDVDEAEQAELEKKLDDLRRVRDLISIACDLYPFEQ